MTCDSTFSYQDNIRFTTAHTTHESHVFEHVSDTSAPFLSWWLGSIEVGDLYETYFPSEDPREWSRGVAGRSTTSPADCTVDEEDVCTTPATSHETKNAEWQNLLQKELFPSFLKMKYVVHWGMTSCKFWGGHQHFRVPHWLYTVLNISDY